MITHSLSQCAKTHTKKQNLLTCRRSSLSTSVFSALQWEKWAKWQKWQKAFSREKSEEIRNSWTHWCWANLFFFCRMGLFFFINAHTHSHKILHGCVIAPGCLFERVSTVAGAPEWAELLRAPAPVPTLARGRTSSTLFWAQAAEAGAPRATQRCHFLVRSSASPAGRGERQKNKEGREQSRRRAAAADKTTHLELKESLSLWTKRLGSFISGMRFRFFFFLFPQEQTSFSRSAERETKPAQAANYFTNLGSASNDAATATIQHVRTGSRTSHYFSWLDWRDTEKRQKVLIGAAAIKLSTN